MDKLIKSDAVLKKLSRMIDYCKTDREVSGLTALFQVGDAVMDIPPVDAVEVIRCENCKHYCAEYCVRDIGGRSNMFHMKPDDFCSYGERGKWDEL